MGRVGIAKGVRGARRNARPAESRAIRDQELDDFPTAAQVSLDRAGQILEANAAAVALLGLRRARIRRARLASQIVSVDADDFERHRRAALADGEPRSIEVELAVSDRPVAPVLVTIVPLARTRAGKTACHCVLVDLSAWRGYQQKLRRMAFDFMRQEEHARRRIAADIHDRIGQALAVAHMKLATVRPSTSDNVRAAVDDALRLLQKTLVDTRGLTFEISLPILYDLGILAALRWLAEEMTRRHGLLVEIRGASIPKLSDDVAAVLFRCVRELLVNVAKHARTDRATVVVRATLSLLRIEVRDAGCGFQQKTGPLGMGLFGVREQVRQLGGSFDVKSSPSRGTCARIVVGLRGPSAEQEEP